MKAARPPASPTDTYMFCASHMSQPHVAASLVPISHQLLKWLTNWSMSSARWQFLEDELGHSQMRAIRNQTGAFITKCRPTIAAASPMRTVFIFFRIGHKSTAPTAAA